MIQDNFELTKMIQLTRGKTALVDAEDYAFLSQWQWWCNPKGYAIRSRSAGGKNVKIYMHREVMKAERGQEVDHINGDKADNRKANLRFCTHLQNCYNRTKIKNKLGYLGVFPNGNGFTANITLGKRIVRLGTYRTKEEAARKRDEAALRLHGKFARLNFPTEEVTQCEQV